MRYSTHGLAMSAAERETAATGQRHVTAFRPRDVRDWQPFVTVPQDAHVGRVGMRTVRLLHLDGRPWASAGFLDGSSWTWIANTVARECECDEDQVGCVESDDGDLITVDGLPVYRVG